MICSAPLDAQRGADGGPIGKLSGRAGGNHETEELGRLSAATRGCCSNLPFDGRLVRAVRLPIGSAQTRGNR
jgi:hypothetical protein